MANKKKGEGGDTENYFCQYQNWLLIRGLREKKLKFNSH